MLPIYVYIWIKKMKNNIIYALREPRTDEYRYIGKSNSGIKRAKSHLTFSHNNNVNIWVQELRELGLSPIIDVLEECEEELLNIKESFWIQYYEECGCKLFNSLKYSGHAIEKLKKEVVLEKKALEK